MVAFGVIQIRPLEDAPEVNDIFFFDENDQEANTLGNFHSDDPRISVIFPNTKQIPLRQRILSLLGENS